MKKRIYMNFIDENYCHFVCLQKRFDIFIQFICKNLHLTLSAHTPQMLCVQMHVCLHIHSHWATHLFEITIYTF